MATGRGTVKLLKVINNKEFNTLNNFFDETVEIVNPLVEDLLTSEISSKYKEVISYQISTGGKLIRPALVIATCEMLGGNRKDSLHAAAALEILHNYTLIIDDIIDNSSVRRGLPTTWKLFGKSIAQCAAIPYVSAIFQAAGNSNNSELLIKLFAKTLKIISEGEILDILSSQTNDNKEPFIAKHRYCTVTLEEYLDMISKKTAFLFEVCSLTGGICANASKGELQLLSSFGFNFGMAFQIQDDILDIFGDNKSFGKMIGKDIIERKLGNIVVLLALNELDMESRRDFLKIYDKRPNRADIEKAIKTIRKTNALEESYKHARNYIKKAENILKKMPANKWNTTLTEIANYMIARDR